MKEPRQDEQRAYLEAIVAELKVRGPAFADRLLVSIYVGGGTPSLWPAPELALVIEAVQSAFPIASRELEITLEANPTDCTKANLEAWFAAGINRLSIGVQSSSDSELIRLGRDHRMGDGLHALDEAIIFNRFRISTDVIIGTPTGDTAARAGLTTLEAIVHRYETGGVMGRGSALADHVSVYELTFEDGAPLGHAAARGEIIPRDDDELAELYGRADQMMSAHGFEHYEISSYARFSGRSIHNSLYWQGADILGLGAAAASHRQLENGGALRETNLRSASRYLSASPGTIGSLDETDRDGALRDRIWLGLRTRDGIDGALLDGNRRFLDWLLEGELATVEGTRIRPTLRGFLYADAVALRISS